MRRDAELNHALAVAAFNLGISQPVPPADAVAGLVERTKSLVYTGLTEVTKRLARGEYSYAARAAARRVAMASDLLVTTAVPLATQTATGNETTKTRDEPASLIVADCIRRLLWFAAAMKNIGWRCTWPTVGAADQLRQTAELPTLAKTRTPRRPNIARLLKGTVQVGDDLIELAGTVQSVEITHEAKGKAVSRVTLAAGDSTQFTAEVNGFKADSTGLAPGTYTALSGTWRAAGSDDKGARLIVGRESITGNRATSFEAHLYWLTAAVYLPVPHGLMVRSNWIRGLDGPLNPVRYAVTSREK